MNVGRKRHVADGVHDVVDRAAPLDPDPDAAASEELPLEHLPHQHSGPRGRTLWRRLETNARARLQLLTWMHQRGPDLAVRILRLAREEQTLHRAAARDAMPEQACGKHAG